MDTLAKPPPVAAPAQRMSLTDLLGHAQRLQQAGRPADAATLYADWIAGGPAPMRHVVCFNWGTLLSAQGQLEAAEAAYRQALADEPGFAHALLNLGHMLERRGQPDAALAQWRAVIDGPRSSVELRRHALNNSGRVLETLRRFPEAEAMLVESLRLDARQRDVIQHYVHLRQKQCAWPAQQRWAR